MVRAVCLLAAALLLGSSGAAYSRSQASPTTLVSTKTTIAAFAQDGDQIAWASVDKHSACTSQVWIRLLGPKKQKLVTKPAGPTCYSNAGFNPYSAGFYRFITPELVLAGKRALWTVWSDVNGTSAHRYVVTASYAGTRDVALDEFVFDSGCVGDYLFEISGDSSTLVYGVVSISMVKTPGCKYEVCDAISGGGVERITGTDEVAVPGAPPPFALAASGHRIAVVVAEKSGCYMGGVRPGSPATVKVEDAVSGANIGSFSLMKKPIAIALGPSVVAVLESTAGGRQIEFRTHAGALLRTVAVPAKAEALSTTDKRAVFHVGRSIQTVRVKAGGSTKVASAGNAPIGLSIEGTRIAWAENVVVNHVPRGRIRAINVY